MYLKNNLFLMPIYLKNTVIYLHIYFNEQNIKYQSYPNRRIQTKNMHMYNPIYKDSYLRLGIDLFLCRRSSKINEVFTTAYFSTIVLSADET